MKRFIDYVSSQLKPITLFCVVLPILFGTSLAYADGIQNFSIAGWLLFAATVICFLFSRFRNSRHFNLLAIFFLCGPMLSCGSYWLQSHEINLSIVLAGFIPGCMTVSIFLLPKTTQSWGVEDRRIFSLRNRDCIISTCTLFILLIWPFLISGVTNDYRAIRLSFAPLLFLPIFYVGCRRIKKQITNATATFVHMSVYFVYCIIFFTGWIR